MKYIKNQFQIKYIINKMLTIYTKKMKYIR